MDEEKQIEEMAHHLCLWWDGKICTFTKHECNHDCSAFLDSARLYNAGYRQQIEGEWLAEIEYYDNDSGDYTARKVFKCSKCGRKEKQKEPYCNCGAKMKGA